MRGQVGSMLSSAVHPADVVDYIIDAGDVIVHRHILRRSVVAMACVLYACDTGFSQPRLRHHQRVHNVESGAQRQSC